MCAARLLAVVSTVLCARAIPMLSTIPVLVPFPDPFPVTASIAGIDANGHTTFVVLDPTDDTVVTQTEVIGEDFFSWYLSAPEASLFGEEICTRTGAGGGEAYSCRGAFGAGVPVAATTIPPEAWGFAVVDVDVEVATPPPPTTSVPEATATHRENTSSNARSSSQTVSILTPDPTSTGPTNTGVTASLSGSTSATTSGNSSTPPFGATKKSLAGPIAGGTIGGLALLSALVFFLLCIRRQTNARRASEEWRDPPLPFSPDSEKFNDGSYPEMLSATMPSPVRLVPNRGGDRPNVPLPLAPPIPGTITGTTTDALLQEMQAMRAEMQQLRIHAAGEPPPQYPAS